MVSNRKRADIEADLEAQGFDKMAKSKDVSFSLRDFADCFVHYASHGFMCYGDL